MSSGTESGTEAASWPAACYRELSCFPAVTRAALGATAGGQTFLLYTECSRPDLSRRRLLRFSRHYSLQRTGSGGLAVSQAALSAEIRNQLLSQDSPTGQHRAVLSRCPRLGHELLEVWDSSGRSHSVDLTALGKHGEIYTEETWLLYVAEKSRPKPQPPCPWDVPGAARPAEEDKDEQDERFVYHEDWGEALSTRSMPVLCALDLEGSSLSVLEGVPEHLCPGQVRIGCREIPCGGQPGAVELSSAVIQALWSPDDHGVVFVGWWHEPFRLGLSACSNRRSGIFYLDLASGHCELLSSEYCAACSPRLSPDGQRLIYLEGDLGGPHRQCLRLCMINWQTRQAVTVLDVVHEPTEAFAGLYGEALPPWCWAADSRRVVLGTAQRSRKDLLLVDTETAVVTNLTAGSPEGCWELLTFQWDLLVATCSAPHHPPSLVVAVLPPAGRELPIHWVPVEDSPAVPGVTWKTLQVQPPQSRQSPTSHGTLAFEALLLSPPDSMVLHPLIVCPHGGPHAVFDARWRPSMAALCRLGFAVLLVNYRGSLGFGQASIHSLLSCVGEQDVADTQLAVEQALSSEPLDPHRLALLAGSHGAFIALHLLAHEPERYQACALRSPVSNLPALLGTSDIPDWRYTSLGLPYSFERVPCTEDMITMLLHSPIARAAQVQTPVLLCVGARDRRVSPTQALELYRLLRARGVPTRLLWYPDDGHALTGVEAEANVFENYARWFLQHLGQPQQDGTGQHRS
ncbi:acylamino-acid-releasing enzyme-like isoform X2 [Pogoniulus pusillus]|uniref:acylamino-acid-releasing enzyme-like isoform X2 n=1 Tax=Pogoniulus pusillus TaxID=488313 RepID=UPI0030B97C21